MDVPGIVGRDQELSQIATFVADQGFPGALLLEGEAGIGKTTLWWAGVELARERGRRVLVAHPSGSESQLSFAGVRDLLEPLFDETADTLPSPQRHALAVALLREEPGPEPPPEGAVAAGVVGVLHQVARGDPVLVAVDDVQWLDAPSAALLEFAARRVGDAEIGFLVARRHDGSRQLPLALRRAFPDRLTIVSIGPLSLGAVYHLIRDKLGVAVARPLLRRIHETSGGNPLFALEFVKAMQDRRPGRDHPDDRLPLPETVHELLGDRLTSLPEPVGDALLLVAASSQPTLELLDGILEEDAEALLEPATARGIVDVVNGAIRFAHPLFASAVDQSASAAARRRAHELLAGASSDLEEHARHLALSTTGSSAEVAALLHEAGRAARTRGAPAAAGELLEHAIAFTPSDDVRARTLRSVDAATALGIAGDRARARRLLEGCLPSLDPGPLRAEVLIGLSDLVEDDPAGGEASLALIEQSLREAGSDPRLRVEALLRRDLWERSQDRLDDALEVAKMAVTVAEQAGDEYLLAHALTREADLEIVLGHAEDPPARFRRALELNARVRIDPSLGPASMLGVCLVRAGRVDEARMLLQAEHHRALEEGNEEARSAMSLFLTEAEWLAGRWADASQWARQGLELADQCGYRIRYGAGLSVLALVEASRGEVGLARRHATEGIELCESIQEHAYALFNRQVLGFLELSVGDAAAAWKHLSGFSVERGIEGTKRISFIGDAIEALLQLGHADEATRLIDEVERRGRQLHRPTLLAVAARCRALALGTGAREELSVTPLERSIEALASLNLPFERARTLLVMGEVLRRAKRKRAARDALGEALAVFEELGATLWALKAQAELARVGGRRPAGARLTETERRVAELVAEGRSNKEVAAALYVSVKAVEANLSRIYAKLGVRSRTELTRLLSGSEAPTKL